MRRLIFILILSSGAGWASDPASSPQDALLGTLPLVEAAALHAQTLEEAPANVTIFTAGDLRKYGYRTLNDVISAARGFFSSYDRIYHYIGVSGFSLLGDYNTRFLVMLNGHPLTDQVYNANGSFGQDLGIDMDLVLRIEIIRGSTSALYGSNGILANINIVTKSPVDLERLTVSTETGSFGEKKVLVSSSSYLGRGANLLVSASVFNNAGGALRFPGVDGELNGIDGERGYHTFANLIWHDWSFTAYFNNREKQPPVAWGDDASPFQRGDNVRDSRNFLLASYTRTARLGKLRWQNYYDQYKYDDRFYYPMDSSADLEDVRSSARGDSVGSQVSWQMQAGRIGELTVGAQLDAQIRNLQGNEVVHPVVVHSPGISEPDTTGALFAQQQWRVSPSWTLYAGLRMDISRNFGRALSPRAALIYQASPKTTYKLVYGRPFRNPSTFENYYSDGGQAFLANGALRPETGQTLEAAINRKLRPNLSFIAGAYEYRLMHLIRADFLPGNVEIFRNSGDSRSRGIELELSGKAGNWLEASASGSYQHSLQSSEVSRNLPRYLSKFRAATPLWRERLWLSAAFQYASARQTLSRDWVRPVALANVTVSTNRLHPNFDMVAGVRNVAGWRYSDPAGLALDRVPADGRSFFVKLIYHTRE